MEQTISSPLTIAYDAKRAYVNYRGLGNYCRNLFVQMAQFYGENHYLLCTPQDKELYPWLNEKPFERVLPSGLWTLAPSIWRRMGIPDALMDKHIDIYHGLSQELPKGIGRLGCKTVVTMHDAIFFRYPDLYSASYRRSFIRRNESACRRADLIIAISQQTKRDYIDFFGVEENRIRVVYQGCNELFWKEVTGEMMTHVRSTFVLPKNYVLCVGALEERKNQMRIIEAMASEHIDMPLVLVGRGNADYQKRLYKYAKRYGVQLKIIENANTSDLPAIYRMASVFVYPSLFEGFGIPVLEAARSETPIVTSRGTCFEEIAGEGALYVPPTQAEAIGEAICITLQNQTDTDSRVQKALVNTEKFRAVYRAHDLMCTYKSLL